MQGRIKGLDNFPGDFYGQHVSCHGSTELSGYLIRHAVAFTRMGIGAYFLSEWKGSVNEVKPFPMQTKIHSTMRVKMNVIVATFVVDCLISLT